MNKDQNQQTFEEDTDGNIILPRKRIRNTNCLAMNINYPIGRTDHDESEVSVSDLEFDISEKEPTESESDESKSDESEFNGNDKRFENYSCPQFTLFQEQNDQNDTQSTNNQFLWILIWIMKFRTRFNLPETATESLIKFIKLLLKEIGSSEFDFFSDSLYLVRKILNLKDQFYSFVIYSKYHKLYNKQEVKEFCQNNHLSVIKCRHIEFLNSSTRKRKLCKMDLSK